MFEYSLSTFGKYKKHTFADENGNSFSLIPEFGASLINLTFLGNSVLDSYGTSEALTENKWSKGIFLFPYPNRLRDGKYSHLGEDYQFDINNAGTGNSIHGFGKNVPMHVTSTEATENYAFINCRWLHDGMHAAYPFPFQIDISFKIISFEPLALSNEPLVKNSSKLKNKSSKLEISMAFENKSKTSIPVGLGWHPYFMLTPNVGDTQLQMPKGSQLIEIDARMLPTGKKENYTTFDNLRPIGETTLDNGFFLTDTTTDRAETIIANEENTLKFWQETGAGKFNFLQVFTPPTGKSIAIEPMTCNIDAFNNKDGLVLLSPNAVLEGKFGVEYK